MPKAWKDFLETAIKEGKIPNIPQTTLVNGTPTYPNGTDPNSSQVCSAIPKNCKIDGDYWNAPIGHVALAFDDGPGLGSAKLYKFLQKKNLKATHFFIGRNILTYPQLFLTAFNMLHDDIGVHTYTHPSLSSLSNEQIFAELAFTMQIIHDSTGGRVPRIFRPPFGDTDMRVHSIAKVLGLTTIIWNQDTEDWHLASGGMTQAQISSKMRTWLAGPKSPGLVMLEHELSNETAQVFINNYPLIPGSDWDIVSAAQMDGLDAPYQNAKGTTGTAKPVAIVPNENNATSTSTSTPARWSQSTTSWARSSSKSTPGPSKSNKVNGVSRTPALGMPALSVVAVLTSGVVWLF
ncbi:hypothetical protein BJV77DRAFT_503866 [Russula vinacea]|nr:hypothetical protein BJV77DRAFT_503866 [Russula vinacea]